MKAFISILVLAALAIGGVFFMRSHGGASDMPLATTTAATSTTATTTQSTGQGTVGTTTVTAKIGQMVSAGGVSISLSSLSDDSRCPTDVQCIWAGTVHVAGTLGSGMGTSSQVFALGEPITTEAEVVTLVAVSPAKNSKTHISESDYRFTFEIVPRK